MIFLQRCLMGGGGVVIDNNVNDDTIKDDGFVDSISAENVVDDWVVGDNLAVADIWERKCWW